MRAESHSSGAILSTAHAALLPMVLIRITGNLADFLLWKSLEVIQKNANGGRGDLWSEFCQRLGGQVGIGAGE